MKAKTIHNKMALLIDENKKGIPKADVDLFRLYICHSVFVPAVLLQETPQLEQAYESQHRLGGSSSLRGLVHYHHGRGHGARAGAESSILTRDRGQTAFGTGF